MRIPSVVRHGFQRSLGLVLRWYFAILSVSLLFYTFDSTQQALHGRYASLPLFGQILHVSIPPILAVVFGIASFTIWREKDSAKAWVTWACLANLTVSIAIPLLLYYCQGAGAFWQMETIFCLPTAIGVIGLAFFSPPDKQQKASAMAHRNWAGARMPFAGIFALTSVVYFGYSLYTVYRHHAGMPVRMQFGLALGLTLAFIFGAAWWNLWMERPSADSWGIAASFVYALMFLRAILTTNPPDLAHNLAHNFDWLFKNVGGLAMGTFGIVVFSHYFQQDDSILSPNEPSDPLSGTRDQKI
jgi:hypothetical protein